MCKENRICVIIPVHKSSLLEEEKISLIQCQKILFNYDVFLVHPLGINVSNYLAIYPNLRLISVPPSWLNSIEAYNKMKCSLSFYKLFRNYSFMLTYELDALIFSDKWGEANSFSYDYIGAPWFENYNVPSPNSEIIGVGNSGFSLRNINTCLDILNNVQRLKIVWNFFKEFQLHRLFRFSIMIKLFFPSIKSSSKNHFFFRLFSDAHINEDLFWANIIPSLFTFKVSDVKDAIKFSFEVNPSQLYELNRQVLPLGCHAWSKYDCNFWIPFIREKVIIED